MGIHTHIDPLDADALDADAAGAADELLARVLDDFAKSEFSRANETNRKVAGDYVPYTVAMDGKVVGAGKGSVFPEHQIGRAREKTSRERQRDKNVELGRKLREIVIEWAWAKVTGHAARAVLRGLLESIGVGHRAEALANLAYSLGSGEFSGLLTYLLAQKAEHHSDLFKNIQEAWFTIKVMRLVWKIQSALSGSPGGDTRNDDVLRWIAGELFDRSPVVSGGYRERHILFADGKAVAKAEEIVAGVDIPAADEYVFVNAAPYSRKIEIGKTSEGRDFVLQVENRIYERVAEDAQAKFRAEVAIRSEWRDEGSYPVLARGNAGRPYRYPAIVVRG